MVGGRKLNDLTNSRANRQEETSTGRICSMDNRSRDLSNCSDRSMFSEASDPAMVNPIPTAQHTPKQRQNNHNTHIHQGQPGCPVTLSLIIS